ncbi:tyrosine kinase receptor Cad96Ca isoform X2 [Drosophila biarmipes]|uniref:tyrosine kinase receptor Cad96Ca isoform X2 n=1 Tax=Drosophila biarmipes TaxID=125945 RepID=UPI001CDAA06C|nr:tyrosine kinase receptor Cad96Ca isoform X2 [Drosophila biarmipes]
MVYHHHNHESRIIHCGKQLISWRRRSLLLTLFVVTATVVSLLSQEAEAHDQNAPPILYVRERNWRISETEKVGQIIDRVRAEDPDGDDLIFGIEPRFSLPPGGGNGPIPPEKIPFKIDRETGVVTLNESLAGRAGQNFLIYITVTDGVYTAKNEVFINILGERENSSGFRPQTSISNVVSQFLPRFDQLPGVQSIRNGLPNSRPGGYPPVPQNNIYGQQPFANFYPPPPPNFPGPGAEEQSAEQTEPSKDDGVTATTAVRSSSTTPRSRTKLTPITGNNATRVEGVPTETTPSASHNNNTSPIATVFSLKSGTIPIVVTVGGFFAATAVLLAYLCRRRLCAISRTLKKSKEKEELAKKSNQSQLSSTLTDDSRNSMVMQQWQGPVAFANRYVPWERDQQLGIATSQLSTGVTNGGESSAGVPAPGTGEPGSSLGPGCVAGGAGSSGPAENGFAAEANGDRWEFPRHRLKFFNILGEGAFGQVWRCEATNINVISSISTWSLKELKMEQIVHSISGVPQSYWLMQSGSCCPIFKCSGGAELCMWAVEGWPSIHQPPPTRYATFQSSALRALFYEHVERTYKTKASDFWIYTKAGK